MRRMSVLTIGLALVFALTPAFGPGQSGSAMAAAISDDQSQTLDTGQLDRARPLQNDIEHFVAPAPPARAVLDTVYLYGGPGSLDGKFEDATGTLPDTQGWTTVDRTQVPSFWHVSTFNAGNFAGAAGNQAMWSGVEAGTIGYPNAPGYGNSWNDILVFSETVTMGVAHSVRLAFEYNHDSEPGYDFFGVDYDSAGTWINLLSVSGTNDDGSGTFPTPAIFDQTVNIPAGSLGGAGDEVRLRISFVSDGAASDEDVFFDSTAGACQIDNINVTIDGGLISTADFDGAAGDGDWVIFESPFAGDYARIFSRFAALDPCRANLSPQFGFIDDGRAPHNSPVSTGGETSAIWQYGILGNFVVNYSGGVSFNQVELYNEIWSPEIDWDLPGTDDDAAVGGVFLRKTIWEHVPLVNGIFWIWSVRSFPDANGNWTGWNNTNTVWFEDLARYSNITTQVAAQLVSSPEKVQIALGVIDLSDVFSLPGGDATPGPLFDNVALGRCRVGGPAIVSQRISRFQDSFPNSGSVDPAGGLVDLSMRLDGARDIIRATGINNLAADSMTITVTAVRPGTSLAAAPEMNWVLDANPLFDSVRVLPVGALSLGTFTGPDGRSWNRWEGTVIGQLSTAASGDPIAGNYFFDLPDGPAAGNAPHQSDEDPMFFPGDQLRYYFEATDTGGGLTTAPVGLDDPANLADFQDGSWGIVGRAFTVMGLPTMLDSDGDGVPTQPEVLVYNDFGRRGGENDFLTAMNQNGYQERVHFDTYTTQRPDASLSNGLGTSGVHGANSQQISGYSTLFYFSGDLSAALGDGVTAQDKTDDIELLEQWRALPGDRHVAYFGDYIATSLAGGTVAALAYLQNAMGADYQDITLRDDVGGQTAPIFSPTGNAPIFSGNYVAYGGCLGINEFDAIVPLGNGVAGHEFLTPDGLGGQYLVAGSVVHQRTVQIIGDDFTHTDVTFPFGFVSVRSQIARASTGLTGQAQLVSELLDLFGNPGTPGVATPAPATRMKTALMGNAPNPFNPSTSIALRIGEAGRYSLKVYNLRGEFVRTLLDGEIEAGERNVVWDGTDAHGRNVSSGVYLYRLDGKSFTQTQKMALVK
ncbi:hypothetical protein DRQ53_00685 [bacterium]|nr:MAG: hypothetical protein DRQ53_00685 [bacterium]